MVTESLRKNLNGFLLSVVNFDHSIDTNIAYDLSDGNHRINRSAREDDAIKQLNLAQRNIINLQKKIEHLEMEANTCSLTGLFNKGYMNSHLTKVRNKAVEANLPFAVIMFDADYFKAVNDTYGHIVGDLVIKKLASIFNAKLPQDGIVARWGGEEFCMILPDLEASRAYKFAENVRREVESRNILSEIILEKGKSDKLVDRKIALAISEKREEAGLVGKMPLTLSVGVYTSNGIEADEPKGIMQKVDDALYHVKNNGRNGVKVVS